MGIWEMSLGSQSIARSHTGLLEEFKKALPSVTEDDILSSPYAIFDYQLNPELTDRLGLKMFRTKLQRLQKKLILDFVPNHMALDSPLVALYPNCFLKGKKVDHNHFLHSNGNYYAHGRDPFFDGWTDTIQWDFSAAETLDIHKKILHEIASHCDGVRCDMAMLALPDVFEKTHGTRGIAYWNLLIEDVRKVYPDFKFYAEAYWNREYDLQCLGFNGTYDKTLHDRLTHFDGIGVSDHLSAELSYQEKSIRFIENHDELRAYALFGERSKDYFSLLTFIPGIILYYSGQEIGTKMKLPVQMGKREIEPRNISISEFYDRAFEIMAGRNENIVRSTPSTERYADGIVLSYVLSYENKKELFIWNPMDFEISGKVFIEGLTFFEKELLEIVSGESFLIESISSPSDGFYFKLSARSAQWFCF